MLLKTAKAGTMTDKHELIEIEQIDQVARLTLNRPHKRNALNPALLDAFDAITDRLDRDPSVSVIVIRGAGPSFCAGYDISSDGDPQRAYRRAEGDILADWRAMREHANRWKRLWSLPTPTVSQIQGYCLGGGAELALSCDLVFAAEDATIGHPVVRDLGVPTANVYPYLIGLRRTKELMLTGATLTGSEAEQAGLINRAIPLPELDDYVLDYAQKMARTPKPLLVFNKQATNDAFSAMGYERALESGADFDALAHLTHEVRDALRRIAESKSVGDARRHNVASGA
jgi:enoyl-CoA hydratase